MNADIVLRILGSSTLCGFIGGYVDHIFTADESTAMRQSIRDAKAAIEAKDWPKVTTWISGTCERYFCVLFGPGLFSLRASILTFSYAFAIAFLSIPRLERDAGITLFFSERLAFSLAYALPCAVVDLCILAWARTQLRRLAAGVGHAPVVLLGIVIASYAGIGVAVVFADIVGATVVPWLIHSVEGGLPTPPLLYVLLAAPVTWPYIIVSPSFGGDPNVLFLVLPAALSGLVVMFSLLVTVLIISSPRFIGQPVASGLDKLASSSKGVFATIGAAIGALINGIHELMK